MSHYILIFQHTVIVERWWQVPLSKVGRLPRLHPRRHRIYRLVEDLKHAPKEDLELILTQTIPSQYLHHFCEKPKITRTSWNRLHVSNLIKLTGLGERGDTVFVKKSFGRNKLLAQGLAVYASPENRQMFAEELRVSDSFMWILSFKQKLVTVLSCLYVFHTFYSETAWRKSRGENPNPNRTVGEFYLLKIVCLLWIFLNKLSFMLS